MPDYGHAHRKERKRWAAIVANQGAICTRCHGAIYPGDPFELDHDDNGVDYLGPAHPRCNRGAGGVKGRRNDRLRRIRTRNW